MKSLRSKLTLVLAFFAAIMISLGFVFMPQTASASVDTSTGFYVQDGASIRLVEGESGIRWTAHLTKSAYEQILADADSKGGIKEIGISIIPSSLVVTDENAADYRKESKRIWKGYEGSIADALTKGGIEITYNWAIFYDNLVVGSNVTEEQLYEAYAMNLEAIPYVLFGNDTYYYGETYDTSRSLRDVAISYLAAGEYPASRELLESFVYPGSSEVQVNYDGTEYATEDYYSNVDEVGSITIDDAIVVDSNTRIFYNAKDVTALFADGVVALSDVIVNVTKDGGPSDFLTIFHEDTGLIQKQYFVGVTLAIDHIDDFRYFTLSSPVTDKIVSPDGEGTFDGYYILTQNIDANDATGMPVAGMAYNHTFAGNSGFSVYDRKPAQLIEDVKEGGIFYNKGFTGTFDGQGYVISDLVIGGGAKLKGTVSGSDTYYKQVTAAQTKGGLFGIINGGTVKNVAFNNLNLGVNASGVFADAIVNRGTISNVCYNIYNDLNNYPQCNLIAAYIDNSITLEKMFIEYTRYPSMTGDGGGLVNNNDTVSKEALKTVMQDCYYIANIPAELGPQSNTIWTKADADSEYVKVLKDNGNVNEWWKYATMDAAYVDGEPQSTGHTIVYKSWAMDTQIDAKDYYSIKATDANGKLVGPKEISKDNPYTIDLIPGLKRYSTLTKLSGDKAKNDFNSWDSDIWTTVNGQPRFSRLKAWSVSPRIDGYALDLTGENVIGKESVAEITIAINDSYTIHNLPKVYVTSGSQYLGVSGNKIIGIAPGVATILVTYNHKSWTATIKVDKPIEPYAKELQFSAYDGLFFDGANVVDIEDIIGDSEVLSVTAFDGTPLSYSDGAILGFKYTAKDWTENYVLIETDEIIYKVNIKIAELIIDDYTDFSYFTIKHDWTLEGSYVYRFTNADDFNWTGYYVLAKNIDATGYYHRIVQKLGVFTDASGNISDRAMLNTSDAYQLENQWNQGDFRVGGTYMRGFRGCFDGQGYTISNFTSDQLGLLGYVAGGTIKNLGFVNANDSSKATTNTNYRNTGAFAHALVGTSTISNVFVVTNAKTAVVQSVPFIKGWGYTTYNVSNYLVIDNYDWASYNYAGANNQHGSMFGETTRAQATHSLKFGPYSTDGTALRAMNNAVIISQMPLNMHTDAKANPVVAHTANMDAEYIDGVLNTNKYTVKRASTNVETGPVAGVYRYNSYATYLSTGAERTNAFMATGSYTLQNGFPVFTSAIKVLEDLGAKLYVNGVETADNAEIEVNIKESITLDAKAFNVPYAVSIQVVSGSEFITVNGSTITAKDKGVAVVKVTGKNLSWNLTINAVKKAYTYEQQLTLSASEGIFFDADGNIVDLSSFLDGKEFISITDGKSTNITWADGLLLGATNKKTIATTTLSPDGLDYSQIEFETADARYIINAKIATLAIDSAHDLEYFTLKNSYTTSGTVDKMFIFAEEDFVWNGYYVLVKNIDAGAEGYVHDWTGGVATELSDMYQPHSVGNLNVAQILDFYANVGNVLSYKAGVGYTYHRGFVGTFDGQGYTLSNLVTGRSGLFGIIHGGHVINTGFVNNSVLNNEGGFLAWAAAGGRDQVKNCFVSTNNGVAGKDFAPLVSKVGSHCWEMGKNSIIIDNTTLPETPAETRIEIGSYDSNAFRNCIKDSQGGIQNHPTYGSGYDGTWIWGYLDAFVVSSKPLVGYIEAGSTEITAFIDANKLDGDKSYTTTATKPYSNFNISRYTSVDTFKSAYANNNATFSKIMATNWYKVVDGMITWKTANV